MANADHHAITRTEQCLAEHAQVAIGRIFALCRETRRTGYPSFFVSDGAPCGIPQHAAMGYGQARLRQLRANACASSAYSADDRRSGARLACCKHYDAYQVCHAAWESMGRVGRTTMPFQVIHWSVDSTAVPEVATAAAIRVDINSSATVPHSAALPDDYTESARQCCGPPHPD